MVFDRVIANPPFSLDEWGREVAEHEPWGRFGYGIPPKTKGRIAPTPMPKREKEAGEPRGDRERKPANTEGKESAAKDTRATPRRRQRRRSNTTSPS